MEKEFVPYELALELKELGFNETCLAYMFKHENYRDDIRYYPMPRRVSESVLAVEIPTFSQAFRWFRKKYKLHNGITPYYDYYYYLIKDFINDREYNNEYEQKSYEEAETACLKKLIEIVSQ